MTLRFITFAALFTALHAICATTSLLYCFARVMTRFDNPMVTETYVESLSCRVADVLFQPAMFAWSAVGIRGTTSVLQWVAVLLNSAVWGFALSIAVLWLTRVSMRTRAKATHGD